MPVPKPTQSFVPVKEVRNGVIILKDGGYRGVLMCSSLNFALKSEDEQQAIIGGFQNFLNTLDFSIEIVVHSRKTDIRPYLELLAEHESQQKSELMKIQLREYMQFIKNFIEGSSIMSKMFYIIVPYTPATTARAVTNAIPFFSKPKTEPGQKEEGAFEEYRAQLEQRMALVASGLSATGVRVAPLGTEEIIELLYRSFNLGEMENPIPLTQ
ncbi:MAG: hypothetical protein WAV21_03515 [Minisyncoccia bacterium]